MRAFRDALAVGVGMERDQQIGAALARPTDSLAQREQAVVVAQQHCLEAGDSVDLDGEQPGEHQRDLLFGQAAGAGAGVDAAMAGIDRHDDLAAGGVGDGRRCPRQRPIAASTPRIRTHSRRIRTFPRFIRGKANIRVHGMKIRL